MVLCVTLHHTFIVSSSTNLFDVVTYLVFVISFCVIGINFFGLAFQLPLMMCCAHCFGIYDYHRWRRLRRVWVVIAFTLGMLVTPPDVLSQIIVAIPLCFLYELGLFMIKVFLKKTMVI